MTALHIPKVRIEIEINTHYGTCVHIYTKDQIYTKALKYKILKYKRLFRRYKGSHYFQYSDSNVLVDNSPLTAIVKADNSDKASRQCQ